MLKMNQSEVNHTSRADLTAFYESSAALFTVNLLVSLPANVFVVQLMVRGLVGAVASELFALNLAVAEIIFCMSTAYLIIHFLLRLAHNAGLLVLQYFIRMMFISRPVFQGCICLERYLAVVYPTVFLRFKPLRYRLLLCMADWLLVLLYCTIPTFVLSYTQSTYLIIAKSLFFLLLIFYCGVHVLCVLKQPGPGDGDRESHNSLKRKAFMIIMITMVFTGITELIQVFMLAPTLLYASQRVALSMLLLSEGVSIVGGFITPLLFLHRAGKIPCVKHNGLIQEMKHPTAGRIAVPGPAVRFSSFTSDQPTPPPLIGQHTSQVLRDTLSYSDDIITALLESGAVAQNEVS